jgi:hypothetical protein
MPQETLRGLWGVTLPTNLGLRFGATEMVPVKFVVPLSASHLTTGPVLNLPYPGFFAGILHIFANPVGRISAPHHTQREQRDG